MKKFYTVDMFLKNVDGVEVTFEGKKRYVYLKSAQKYCDCLNRVIQTNIRWGVVTHVESV